MSYVESLTLTLPELVLTIGALVLLLVAGWAGDKATRAISWASVLLLFVAGLTLNCGQGVAFGGQYQADAFAAFSKVLIYFAAGASILIAPRFFQLADGSHVGLRAEYPILILLACVGMGMMVSAGDMMSLYVGLELNSLAAYVLASFMRSDSRSAEAGLKYFVLGALASGILLYGISLVYGFTGTTSFAGIAKAYGEGMSMGKLFGLVFVFSGLAFKVSAVPFHMWTPDVYEGAPTPVTTFFASAPKVAAMGMGVRLAVEAMGSAADQWQQIVIFAALASTVLGGVAAINQTNIKRLLAYSSINNVGFALIGLAAGTKEGIAAVLTYLAVYVVMTIGSFVCVLQMRDAEGRPVENISALAGLSRSRPGLAAAFAVFMFSLAGIPPLFGFWPKFLVFDAAVAVGLLPLAAVGIATSVIGAFYYIKVVKIIYFDEPASDAMIPASTLVETGLMTATALAVSPLGYLAIPILATLSGRAAGALF
jgi:NADH-quinone oxidoreductase subunit N